MGRHQVLIMQVKTLFLVCFLCTLAAGDTFLYQKERAGGLLGFGLLGGDADTTAALAGPIQALIDLLTGVTTQLLGQYVSQLRTEYSTGLVLPRKGDTPGKITEATKANTMTAVQRIGRDAKKNETQKKKTKKKRSWKSSDFVFYVSLLS